MDSTCQHNEDSIINIPTTEQDSGNREQMTHDNFRTQEVMDSKHVEGNTSETVCIDMQAAVTVTTISSSILKDTTGGLQDNRASSLQAKTSVPELSKPKKNSAVHENEENVIDEGDSCNVDTPLIINVDTVSSDDMQTNCATLETCALSHSHEESKEENNGNPKPSHTISPTAQMRRASKELDGNDPELEKTSGISGKDHCLVASSSENDAKHSVPTGDCLGNAPTDDCPGNAPTGDCLGNAPTDDCPGNAPTGDCPGNAPTGDCLGNAPTDDCLGNAPTDDCLGNAPTGDCLGSNHEKNVIEQDAKDITSRNTRELNTSAAYCKGMEKDPDLQDNNASAHMTGEELDNVSSPEPLIMDVQDGSSPHLSLSSQEVFSDDDCVSLDTNIGQCEGEQGGYKKVDTVASCERPNLNLKDVNNTSSHQTVVSPDYNLQSTAFTSSSIALSSNSSFKDSFSVQDSPLDTFHPVILDVQGGVLDEGGNMDTCESDQDKAPGKSSSETEFCPVIVNVQGGVNMPTTESFKDAVIKTLGLSAPVTGHGYGDVWSSVLASQEKSVKNIKKSTVSKVSQLLVARAAREKPMSTSSFDLLQGINNEVKLNSKGRCQEVKSIFQTKHLLSEVQNIASNQNIPKSCFNTAPHLNQTVSSNSAAVSQKQDLHATGGCEGSKSTTKVFRSSIFNNSTSLNSDTSCSTLSSIAPLHLPKNIIVKNKGHKGAHTIRLIPKRTWRKPVCHSTTAAASSLVSCGPVTNKNMTQFSIHSTTTVPMCAEASESNQQGNNILVAFSAFTSTNTVTTNTRSTNVKSGTSTEGDINLLPTSVQEAETNSASLPSGSSGVSEHESETVASVMDKNFDEMVKEIVDNLSLDPEEIEKSGILQPNKVKGTDPTKEFECKCCGTQFYTESSLIYHLNRTVYKLLYTCSVCKIDLTFYNKCCFWLHKQKHGSGKPVSLKPFEFTATPPETENQISKERHSNLEAETRDNPEPPVQTTNHGLKCRFCPYIEAHATSLQSHFQGDTGICLFLHTCTICDMDLPSACALKAHKTIHADDVEQMICPECGKTDFGMNAGMREVCDHLDSCMHFNRAPIVSCPSCNEVFAFDLRAEHIFKVHFQRLSKCQSCALRFISPGALINHSKLEHGKGVDIVQYLVLCDICKKMFADAQSLSAHLTKHVLLSPQRPVFGWKCFICSEHFKLKTEMVEHTTSKHTHKAKRCTLCCSLFNGRQNLVDHIVTRKCSRICSRILHFCRDLEKNVSNEFDQLKVESLFQSTRIVYTMRETSSASATSAPTQALLPRVSSVQSMHPCSSPVVSSHVIHQQKKTPLRPTNQGSVSKQAQRKNLSPQVTKGPGGKSSESVEKSKTENDDIHTKNRDCSKSDEVYQCHSCMIVLTTFNNYKEHIRRHAMKGEYISMDVTRCVVCKKLIQNDVLTKHLEAHQARGIIVCSHCQRRDFKTLAMATIHSKNLCFYRQIEGPGDLNQLQLSRKEMERKKYSENSHQRKIKNVGKSTSRDENSGEESDDTVSVSSNTESTNTSISDTVSLIGSSQNSEILAEESRQMFPCLLCGMAFTTKSTLEGHVSRMHDGTRMVYHCMVCKRRDIKKTFLKMEMALKHISRKHRITDKNAQAKLVLTEEENVSSGQKLPFEIHASEDDGASPPKRLRIGGVGCFLCGKCGYSCEDSKEFLQHISSHNAMKEPQCPECGLCFTVLTALRKHLLAVHKIKELDSYLKENKIEEPELVDDEEEEINPINIVDFNSSHTEEEWAPESSKQVNEKKDGENPLECNVCYRVFEEESALKTHMRNHGMAFIRSKRFKHSDGSS